MGGTERMVVELSFSTSVVNCVFDYKLINLRERMLPNVRIEPATVGRGSDRATAPGIRTCDRGEFSCMCVCARLCMCVTREVGESLPI